MTAHVYEDTAGIIHITDGTTVWSSPTWEANSGIANMLAVADGDTGDWTIESYEALPGSYTGALIAELAGETITLWYEKLGSAGKRLFGIV